MKPPFLNSYWLEPDRILCGEYPRDLDDTGAHEKMTAILKAGVRVFLDLTEEGEKKPYREIAEAKAGDLGIAPSQLEFYRHSIHDASVPANQGEMRAILRQFRLARHQGKTIYLHCWGGKGRTGTVAGCAIRDLFGLTGEEALSHLNTRWQACAKSAHSGSPETDEQRGFIQSCNPLRSIEAQVVGALSGAAVGDALGVPVEFAGRETRKSDPVTGMRAFGTHHQPAGTWSDDTSMILATMEGLLQAKGWSPESVMAEFSLWLTGAKHTPHGSVFDIGNATREAIQRYGGGTPPLQCGGTDDWSNGNGSLMRILPVGLAYANDPDLIGKASELSSLTHAHERSRMCCAFFCLVVSELLHGESLTAATSFAREVMVDRWPFSPEERVHFERWQPETLFDLDESEIGSSGHVVDTLEAALWVNARHHNYRDAVLHAVNLGDDTDTTACVAGALAGLIHGRQGIPGEWLEALVKEGEISDLAKRFAEFFSRPSPAGAETHSG
ncbi:MAG: ADP-ribosylglycohydrolase family protein [Verrucomicrobiales bacterium]|nr:ADP-ribosylglycohydrolase family protein [Verrucomicrobiales bacterium]